MPNELTPKQAAIYTKSAYSLRIDTDMLTAVQASSKAGSDFNIASGIRFTGVSGISLPAASSRTGFGFIAFGTAQRQGECLIAVRGTEPSSAHDWLSNVHMSGTPGPSGPPVHEGFNNLAHSILPQVWTAIRGRSISTLHLVGHSLGGATATILADALRGVASIKLYTFGAPRAGTVLHSQFLSAAIGADNIFRVYHDTDPVPMVPIFPFAHVPISRQGYMMTGCGNIISVAAHNMDLYIHNVGEAGWRGLPVISHRRFSFDTVDDVLGMAGSVDFGPAMLNAQILRLIAQALKLLLAEAVATIGTGLFVAATVLDQMAAILNSAAAASIAVAATTRQLLETIMRFMGRALQAGVRLTVAVIRWVLDLLFQFIAGVARQALQRVLTA